jgi:hypothetical protein
MTVDVSNRKAREREGRWCCVSNRSIPEFSPQPSESTPNTARSVIGGTIGNTTGPHLPKKTTISRGIMRKMATDPNKHPLEDHP